jgi:hypothetical protein
MLATRPPAAMPIAAPTTAPTGENSAPTAVPSNLPKKPKAFLAIARTVTLAATATAPTFRRAWFRNSGSVDPTSPAPTGKTCATRGAV